MARCEPTDFVKKCVQVTEIEDAEYVDVSGDSGSEIDYILNLDISKTKENSNVSNASKRFRLESSEMKAFLHLLEHSEENTDVGCSSLKRKSPSKKQMLDIEPVKSDDRNAGDNIKIGEVSSTSVEYHNYQKMENVIKNALPGVENRTIIKLCKKLDDVGVLSIEDLQFIEEQYISDILKPVQVKKFLKFCHETVAASTIYTLQMPSSDSIVVKSEPVEILHSFESDTSSQTETSDVQFGIPSTISTYEEEVSAQYSTDKEHTSNRKKISAEWAENFVIQWNTFPREILEAAERSEIPPRTCLKQMVRILVTQILNVESNPLRKNVEIIVSKIISKYPKTFQDSCGDSIIGNGCTSLLKKILNCIENRRRDYTIKKIWGECHRHRRRAAAIYGCKNWQPINLPSNETKESQEEHQQWLLKEFLKNQKNESQIENLMQRTFAFQRHYINCNENSILSIQREWPFLLNEKYLLQHSETLLGFNLRKLFLRSFQVQGKKIYNFMRTKLSDSSINKCMQEIETTKKKTGNVTPEVIGAILLIMAYFKEEPDSIFQRNVVAVTENGFKQALTPYIATFGSNIYQAEKFVVAVEKQTIICTNSFASALVCFFAVFYVFNLEYNSEAVHTLEFIQRCYADINPERGSKVPRTKKRKYYTVSPKVLKLVNELKSFESNINACNLTIVHSV